MKQKNPRTRKRLPASERKELILDAAMRTFVEFGYHGAIMDTIAERASVTKPILYRHFPSKLDLLLSIVDRADKQLRNNMIDTTAKIGNLYEIIEREVKAHFDFVEKYDMGYRLIYESDLHVDKEVSERIKKTRLDIIDNVAESIRLNTNPAELSIQDAEIIGLMLVSIVESVAMSWINTRDKPREQYERNLIKGIFRILAKLPPRRV
ncbi:MAG: TetR/AcrR family transcriptional regulator [Actinomycetota bacterium]|nr:TetR/AcrR family transcriptional regulator [Actinomycetota bacterium]